MPIKLPILDPAPSGRPHDWSYSKICLAKGEPTALIFPDAWRNPYAKETANRDQKDRGTCVGQSTAYCYDLLYIQLTKDLPTTADKAAYRKDVTDAIGTVHDELFPKSASAEAFYQMSRYEGNVTYPAGSEIRFSARAWQKYGMVLESQWHTDKTGNCVWTYPPGARSAANGGITQEQVEQFAALHKAEGYAQVGTSGGSPTWDEVCYAIYKNGFVLGAIPIYENYGTMQGGDGAFPDPSGELAGFHALCFYGYDADHLYLIHSWGDWCGKYGSISRKFFTVANDLIQFFVILDSQDSIIGAQVHGSIDITANVPASVTVDGVPIGTTPQSIATHPGQKYVITISADGYQPQTRTVDDSVKEQHFTLDPVLVGKKTWIQLLIEILKRIFVGS